MLHARWSALASAENVRQIREAAVDFACASGVTKARSDDIRLAVNEALANAVVHAYQRHSQPGSVCLSATIDGGWLELRVVDDGIGMMRRNDSPGAGLGLPLISRLADQVEVRRRPNRDGTELWMRFRLDDPASTTGT